MPDGFEFTVNYSRISKKSLKQLCVISELREILKEKKRKSSRKVYSESKKYRKNMGLLWIPVKDAISPCWCQKGLKYYGNVKKRQLDIGKLSKIKETVKNNKNKKSKTRILSITVVHATPPRRYTH